MQWMDYIVCTYDKALGGSMMRFKCIIALSDDSGETPRVHDDVKPEV